MLGFDEYMQVPGYLGKETWLTEPLAGLVRATLSWRRSASPSTQLIEMPHVFHSPLGTSEASLDRYLQSLGHSRTISVNSQSCMSAAAIVSQSDHLLGAAQHGGRAARQPLAAEKPAPARRRARTITSTASGTRSTPSNRR